MDEKTKNTIASNALERAQIRNSLMLWKYCPLINSICEEFDEDSTQRDILIVPILEEIAVQAWRLGVRHGEEKVANEFLNESHNEST